MWNLLFTRISLELRSRENISYDKHSRYITYNNYTVVPLFMSVVCPITLELESYSQLAILNLKYSQYELVCIITAYMIIRIYIETQIV